MSQGKRDKSTGDEGRAPTSVDTTVSLYDRAFAELRVAGGIAHASALAVLDEACEVEPISDALEFAYGIIRRTLEILPQLRS